MPIRTEAPRCSEFARSINVLPPGSGLFLSRVVLVSVPLPWPKPALNHPALRPAAQLMQSSAVKTRIFAAEPAAGTAGFDPLTVEVYERHGAEALLFRWHVRETRGLEALAQAISTCPLGALASVAADGTELVVTAEPTPPTFLVCTQGSHDTCCGTSGVALADEIAAQRPDRVVRRVSHTGGHRFSPTFLSFPEGRMWAFADLELVDRIATDTVTATDLTAHSRGWWGAPLGPAQVAEGAVRVELVGQPFRAPEIQPIDTPDGGRPTSFHIQVDQQAWRIDVQITREFPSIACESPGGLPAKPGREYGWTITATDAAGSTAPVAAE